MLYNSGVSGGEVVYWRVQERVVYLLCILAVRFSVELQVCLQGWLV